jgi:cell division protein FtsI (penicillin-binding protein 3)
MTNVSAHGLPELQMQPWRWRLVIVLLLAWFVLLMGRALYLQGWSTEFLQKKGDARSSRVLEVPAHRGMVTDRNGVALAVSTPVASLWVNPIGLEITRQQESSLARLLQLQVSELRARLRGSERDFIYLKRQIPPIVSAEAMRLGVKGLFEERDYRRYYPAGEVAAHVLGFAGVDENGLEGIEYAYQSWLAGLPGSRRVIQDRRGRVVEDVEYLRLPQEGRDLALTLDLDLQYMAYRELSAAVKQHRARSGSVVVLDAKTGEVLSLANYPSYNPNDRTQLKASLARNRAVTDAFEPGSTMKPFTVAAALDLGKIGPQTVVDTGEGFMTLGPARIRDVHPKGRLSVAEALQVSSNVAAAKIALSLPADKFWSMLERAGFGRSPDSGAPGEAEGRLRPYSTWKPIEQATLSYGHGISVSLLQLAQAYTIFANDGRLRHVSLLRDAKPRNAVQVVSAGTAYQVRAMMEAVVHEGGTAPQARVSGYRVAGKTGTAHKLENGQYAPGLYMSSFIGMAPASDPRLIVAVMLDEPHGQYYGGTVAGPAFSRIMAGALRKLDVPPDAPMVQSDPMRMVRAVAEGT